MHLRRLWFSYLLILLSLVLASLYSHNICSALISACSHVPVWVRVEANTYTLLCHSAAAALSSLQRGLLPFSLCTIFFTFSSHFTFIIISCDYVSSCLSPPTRSSFSPAPSLSHTPRIPPTRTSDTATCTLDPPTLSHLYQNIAIRIAFPARHYSRIPPSSSMPRHPVFFMQFASCAFCVLPHYPYSIGFRLGLVGVGSGLARWFLFILDEINWCCECVA